MTTRKAFLSGLFALILGGGFVACTGWAQERNLPFPSYGSGSVEVRLYSDYFCSPCREMEFDAEPILKVLIKKNAIRLILVDFPGKQLTPLLARNFLYALKEKNDLEHAFRVHNILMEAATNKDMTTQKRIETLFKEKRIPFSKFEVKPTFDLYNAMIKEDKIMATPTCIVIKNGQKKVSIGKPNIIKALKALP